VKDGDRILIIEDVITAGTAVREVLPMLQSLGKVHVPAMVLSVDRMERGQGDKTAVQELYEEYGIKVYPIITIREIVTLLHNVTIAGQIVLNDQMRNSIEAYLKNHCVG
jgi:orotate phosphoribosyltransferase